MSERFNNFLYTGQLTVDAVFEERLRGLESIRSDKDVLPFSVRRADPPSKDVAGRGAKEWEGVGMPTTPREDAIERQREAARIARENSEPGEPYRGESVSKE